MSCHACPSLFQADAEAAQKEATRLGAERNAEAEKAQKDGARLRRMEEQLQVGWACVSQRGNGRKLSCWSGTYTPLGITCLP